MKDTYKKQMMLLLSVLRVALEDKRFALKGGTAINLFYRDFPRYSVDLDLTYLPLEDRKTTFNNVHKILTVISDKIQQLPNLNVSSSRPLDGKSETRLVVTNSEVTVRIEPNFTVRGHLFSTVNKTLSEIAAAEFKSHAYANCLSLSDCYGGKICAALDRQHPRDLFDVKVLFDNEGITEDIKDAFILYLLSSSRPINELLHPGHIDISSEYEKFKAMTRHDVTLNELLDTRVRLISAIKSSLTDRDKIFLKSFTSNVPDWNLLTHSRMCEFPAVRWKLLNQKKMSKEKKKKYIEAVDELFTS